MYRIKEVADLAGVSVRTLHHYHRIGLLIPESESPAGYRLYSARDLEILQQILFFKELDFPLSEVRRILDSPVFDRGRALAAQRDLLLEKRRRLDAVIGAVERSLEAVEGGKSMESKELFSAFDMSRIEDHKRKYAAEAAARYGTTAAYAESARRTGAYGEKDWKRISEEGNAVYGRFIAAMASGAASPEASAAVEAWRDHISRNFYECGPELLAGLGALYVGDERFTSNLDAVHPGLAAFMSEAIAAYGAGLRSRGPTPAN